MRKSRTDNMNEAFHVRKEHVQVVFGLLSCLSYVNVYVYGFAYTNQIHVNQYLDLEWPLKIHSCSYFTRKPYLPIRMLFISKRHDIIRQLDEQRTTCTCIYVPNSKCQVYIIVINDIISLVIVKFSSTSGWTFNDQGESMQKQVAQWQHRSPEQQ